MSVSIHHISKAFGSYSSLRNTIVSEFEVSITFRVVRNSLITNNKIEIGSTI